MRVKHYIKNCLILLPVFFGKKLFDPVQVLRILEGFICFSLTSSAVYIFNDIRDAERDRRHPVKKNRPIASGSIPMNNARTILVLCLVIDAGICALLQSLSGFILLFTYFCLNIAYSIGLKNRPIVDILILASGFVIRVFYGGAITGTRVSQWLYLVVITGSLFMGLGKRRNEIQMIDQAGGNTRAVLKYYSIPFLDKNMYVCVALAEVFYALWSLEFSNSGMIWTVPVFIVIMLCYSYRVENNSDADPVEVLLGDRMLMFLLLVYGVFVFYLLYLA